MTAIESLSKEGGFVKAAVLDTQPPQSVVAALYSALDIDPATGCPGVWRSARLTYLDGDVFEGAWLDGEAGDDMVYSYFIIYYILFS